VITVQQEASIDRQTEVLPEQIQATRNAVVVPGDGVHGKQASGNRLLDQFVFALFSIIGVVAGQQRKVDARSQVPVGFRDESQEVHVVLLIPACDVQVAKM
jgi:hypothetical protein